MILDILVLFFKPLIAIFDAMLSSMQSYLPFIKTMSEIIDILSTDKSFCILTGITLGCATLLAVIKFLSKRTSNKKAH